TAGRAIVGGLAARLAIAAIERAAGAAPRGLAVLNMLAGLALAGGAGYFIVRLLAVVRRRLLWRVRRKLILSYIFVGLIPVLLVSAFFLLSGLLLLFNLSSYLVLSRIDALEQHVRGAAELTALDLERLAGRSAAAVLEARQRASGGDLPDLSLAVVPAEGSCGPPGAERAASGARAAARPAAVAGAWRHAAPPSQIPAWIGCSGFTGVFAVSAGGSRALRGGSTPAAEGSTDRRTLVLIRAVAFAGSARAVVADLPLDGAAVRQIADETGVAIAEASPLDVDRARPIPGRPRTDVPTSPPAGPFTWITFLAYRDWASGETGRLLVATRPGLAAMYDHVSAGQGLPGDPGSSQFLRYFVAGVGGLFLVIEAAALAAGLALARSITKSVHGLFVGTERVRRGDFTHKIAVESDDQLGELAGSFNSMTASIEDLLRQAAEKRRLEEELRIAREIQMSLLPQGPVAMPGLSMAAVCAPAREVGGDYYDFFRLGERRLGVLIADVSGKGTSAALYMAELKGLMLSLSRIHTSPRELLLAANRVMAANLDVRSFITMTYATIDLDAGTMRYARAGHTPLIFVPGSDGGGRAGARVLAPDGLVLGLNLDGGELFERLLQEQTIPLYAGDVAVLFTDGISEAMNEADDCFGEGRRARLVGEHARLSPGELRE